MGEPLFHDGWRDPGDDLHRTVFYVSWSIGFIGGFSLSLYALGMLIRHQEVQTETWPGYESAIPGLPIWLLFLGFATALRTGLKLYPELKRLRKQRMKADAVVAAGFLVGIALIILGSERILVVDGQPVTLAILDILGFLVLLASLGAGLFIAFLPKFRAIPRMVPNVRVEARYGLDKRLVEIYDHPSPAEEGCTPVVVLKTPDGRTLTLKAGPAAYDLASPGSFGTAKIAGPKLQAFQPARRR